MKTGTATTSRIIEPHPEAMRRMIDYHNQLVERRKTDLADVTAFAARWAEQAWRIAVVLHAGLHGSQAHLQPLTEETAENAIRITEWFAGEQLDLLTKGRREAAEKLDIGVLALLDANQTKKGVDFITAREVCRARIVRDADAAKRLLGRMEKENLLIGEDVQPPGGGRITRRYRAARRRNPMPA